MNDKTKQFIIGIIKWILAAIFGIGGLWKESDTSHPVQEFHC